MKTIETPEAGHIYRVDDSDGVRVASHLMFATRVTVTDHEWTVEGYKVTDGGTLTDQADVQRGHVGRWYGTDNKAFCSRGYNEGDAEHATVHIPVFSDPHTASGAPLRLAEAKGRKLHHFA